MAQVAVYFSILVCLHNVNSLNLPGPLVYVVTPSPRPPRPLRVDEGRSAPFYYHNWMRRMDSPQNVSSTTTTTTTPKVETPDLIFAEFESHDGDNYRKSLRNLLEKERIQTKTSTTTQPIYVPDDMPQEKPQYNDVLPIKEREEETKMSTPDMTDYFALYNNLYGNTDGVPVFIPSSTRPTSIFTTTTTTTPAPEVNYVQDIWHVIDNEKHNQFSGQWEEAPLNSDSEKAKPESTKKNEETHKEDEAGNDDAIDDNFALPGFGTNPGNGAENESRASRTEPNIRFPYINLKPFQLKNSFKNSKTGSNGMFTNLDNFHEVRNPVRGEAQDVMPMRQPIDRYNPAQPYLPPTKYGIKQKDSIADSAPVKSVANLVPPPPPPSTGNDFPAPDSYESFPPFASLDTNPVSAPVPAPAPTPPPHPPPQPAKQPPQKYQPPVDISYDSPSDDSDDGPPIDLGYRYKPPSPPSKPFLPTLPTAKPFKGYSYDKPVMPAMDAPPSMDTPPFQGYHYKNPKPHSPLSNDQPPDNYDHPPSQSYGHHGPPSYEPDYPELIFNKNHGSDDSKGGDNTKGGDDMKGDDMGMMPPPAPSDMKPDMDGPPADDHGFPSDFPGDFKYHHDFDDHDFYHHHHHHPTTTTTTTTTEMPRVNRYSYYYLGKKLYYLPLYFSVYFIVYVGALIIKAVLRHKIVYPNSFRPNDQTAGFFSKRSVDSWDLSNENLHEITGKVTAAIGKAAEKYMDEETKHK